jgi:hypothetical protein
MARAVDNNLPLDITAAAIGVWATIVAVGATIIVAGDFAMVGNDLTQLHKHADDTVDVGRRPSQSGPRQASSSAWSAFLPRKFLSQTAW